MNKQEYLLVCLAEECAEIQQAVGKVLRFGLKDCAPDTMFTNEELLVTEILDTIALTEILMEINVLEGLDDTGTSVDAINTKIAKVKKYMKYSQERGCLDED